VQSDVTETKYPVNKKLAGCCVPIKNVTRKHAVKTPPGGTELFDVKTTDEKSPDTVP
jgi:hypothetical protein